MSLEQEIKRIVDDFIKEEEQDATDLAKSITAYVELRRFERAKQAITEKNDGLINFFREEPNYSIIRETLAQYVNGHI